jgi:pimeloyl-ACP methyl ester carboxylesterase
VTVCTYNDDWVTNPPDEGRLASGATGRAVPVPVPVLWGDRDRLCMPGGANELAAAIPHARIEMLPGIGHTPQIECPDVIVATIEALLPHPE